MDREYILKVLSTARDKAGAEWSNASAGSNAEQHAGLCRDMFRYIMEAMREVTPPTSKK